jgi:hypothetical protein
LVLDTNVARFGPLWKIEDLFMRAFRLRIAQTALLEWNAACVRQWEGENGSRQEARKKFFGRAKSIASFLDHESPIAMDGGALTARIVAEVD